jgi:hypothetical protein
LCYGTIPKISKNDFNEFGPFNYLGSVCCYTLPLTINFYTHLELYNKIAINKIQRKISQNFQNAMHFSLLNYTSKNEKKGHECCPKKTIASFQ